MSIINNGILLASEAAAAPVTGISRSLRFNSADSAYLSRTPASAGNRKTWTWAGWVKRAKLGVFSSPFGAYFGTSSRYYLFRFNDTDTLEVFGGDYTTGGSTTTNHVITTSSVYRDASAWYHIVIAYNTTEATESNRVKIYVNGVQVTTFSSASYPALNSETFVNATNSSHVIGQWGASLQYFDGYLADIHFIDGQALDPTSFGEFDDNGIWQPIEYSGSYGTNGFKLSFSDNSTTAALGNDDSPNSNTWAVNNFSVASGPGNDSLVDVPVNGDQTDTGVGNEVRGNYCTWNPLDKAANTTLANGNLDCTWAAASGGMKGTIGISSGKWYWEITVGANTSVGLIKSSIGQANSWPGDSVYGSGGSYAYAPNGQKVTNSSYSSYGTAHTNGDVVGVAFDADNGKLFFSLNGTWQASGDPAAGTNAAFTSISGVFSPGLGYWTTPTTNVNSANFGQRPFAYTAPSGFKALCTANLPAPVITKPSEYFDIKLFTGNGSTQTISGLEFSPDFAWFKRRSSAFSHELFDIIRGGSNVLFSDLTSAEANNSALVTSFNSDGVSIGSALGANGSSVTSVLWCWDAGSSTVSNTQGSITSSVRANPSAGFSIVTYTGTGAAATVGHGLGVAPSLIIARPRDATSNWIVYHASEGAGKFLRLNTTDASITDSSAWNNTAPTSTVYSVGNNAANGSGLSVLAYCFAPVAGYSSFGSYTGNGSADGPFVFTGHRSRFVLIKSAGSGDRWTIQDTSRSPYNASTDTLAPNLSNAELANAFNLDILSNGFKVRNTNSGHNTNGVTYIYAAFAESPFNFARAR